MATRRQDIDKPLATEAVLEQGLEVDLLGQTSIKRCMDSPNEWRQMRYERQTDRAARHSCQTLADFRQMAMAGYTVSLEGVRGFAEERVDLSLAPRPGHARLRISDQMALIHRAGFHQRQETELDGRRIAAGVRHQAGSANPLPIDLRQAVHRLLHQIWRDMVHAIPFLPFGNVGNAEIGRKIDNTNTFSKKIPGLLHRDSVGGSEEYDIAFPQPRVLRRLEGDIHSPAQARKHIRDLLARLATGRDGLQLHLGVLSQQPEELNAGIAGATNNANLDHEPTVLAPKVGLSCQIHRLSGRRKSTKPPLGGFVVSHSVSPTAQRLENCLRRRALCRPTFLRSTSRASRVTNPALRSTGLSSASKSMRARVMPWRMPPRWPDSPPPWTLTRMSNAASLAVSSSGWRTIMIEVWRPKYSSTALPLIVIRPSPFFMKTRATEDLRRPVP